MTWEIFLQALLWAVPALGLVKALALLRGTR